MADTQSAAAKRRRLLDSSAHAGVTTSVATQHDDHLLHSSGSAIPTRRNKMEFTGITASTEPDRIRRFHDWLLTHGAGFPKFRIAEVEGFGHGGLCFSDIEADEAFIRLPRSFLLDANAARSVACLLCEILRMPCGLLAASRPACLSYAGLDGRHFVERGSRCWWFFPFWCAYFLRSCPRVGPAMQSAEEHARKRSTRV